MNANWWGPAITIVLFMIVHLVGTVWWMSKIQTTLSFIGDTLKTVLTTIAMHEATFIRKDEHSKEHGAIEKQLDKIWAYVDKNIKRNESGGSHA